MQMYLLSRFIPLCIIHLDINNRWPFLSPLHFSCGFTWLAYVTTNDYDTHTNAFWKLD